MKLKHTSNSISVLAIWKHGIWLSNDFLSHFLTISTLSSTRRFLFSTGFDSSCAVTYVLSSDEMHASMPCKQFKSRSKLEYELETALRISKQDLAQSKTSSFRVAWSPAVEDLIQRNNIKFNVINLIIVYQLLLCSKTWVRANCVKSPGIHLEIKQRRRRQNRERINHNCACASRCLVHFSAVTARLRRETAH